MMTTMTTVTSMTTMTTMTCTMMTTMTTMSTMTRAADANAYFSMRKISTRRSSIKGVKTRNAPRNAPTLNVIANGRLFNTAPVWCFCNVSFFIHVFGCLLHAFIISRQFTQAVQHWTMRQTATETGTNQQAVQHC